MIIAQKPTQSLAAPHRPLAVAVRVLRKQQDVTLPLMIPLGMEMVDIVAKRMPQRALAEENHLGQVLLLDRPHPALCVGIQVRTARRQRERFNPTRQKDGAERPGEFRVPIMQEITTILLAAA
jgi:hypothetical protein